MTQSTEPPSSAADAEDRAFLPGGLARELFTLKRDPLPKMSRPRWLAWLPHVVLTYAAIPCGVLTGMQLNDHYKVTGAAVLGLSLLTSATILLSMFRPIAAWWLGLAAAALIAWVIHDHVGQGQSWPWTPAGPFTFAPLILMVALRVPPRVTVWVIGITLALSGLAEAVLRPPHSQTIIAGVAILFGFVGLLGYALRATRLARGKLVEQETLTEEERARRTLLEERSRIARELHDVVAHHMSVISIQAQVAPHLVENPSAELKENLTGIRENALEALTELRRVLGVLRSEHPDDPANPHHPQPTLAELDGLVDNVRGAGLEVTTEIAGVRRPLTPGVELTAYRIVQEALSNCLRHAPGSRVEVGVAYGPRDLHLCVANSAPTRPAPPSHGAGHGLLGMRERAGMLGGELAAGPRPDGGYEVSAVLPMDPRTDARDGAPGSSPDPKKDV
ncbi:MULTISPECIES: sensor histidine kinase [unclassified Streptomyces]|uniref:sensor histidine kinase n=1 Tax=unclassified Streptomyces TaxID=2593676 RepID=UPI00225374ED|nr:MULTISPECIES: histidine kinase [unclassified Streptomyces]MCX4527125.1 histidine kinase [Streptomyces sp. NBC_01551]MCX4542299.1 histidine kinase [Streptomyces sp. NBC_01565]